MRRVLMVTVATCALVTSSVGIGTAQSSSEAQIVWREEFKQYPSLATQANPSQGRWLTRGADDAGSLDQGYRDYAGSSWNTTPAQHPDHDPFSIRDGHLVITVKRTPADITNVGGAQWMGGYLVTNPRTQPAFGYGYYEWRARWPNPGQGMFPALWMFSNHLPGQGIPGKQSAEIDMFEIFGNASGQPWTNTVHRRPDPGLMSSGPAQNTSTTDWHRYGLHWEPERIRFFRDGQLVHTVSGTEAAWFTHANRGIPMGLRINYAMDPQWSGPPKSTATNPAPGWQGEMHVDYIRVYDTIPTNLATGTADPETPTPTPTPTTPGAPTDVTASTSDTSATIRWQPPTDSAPISGYRVARDGIDSNNHGAWSGQIGAETRDFTFTNLVPGSAYNLTVTALNGTNEGPPITVRVIADGSTPQPPSAPTAVVGTPGDSTATISWQPPIGDTSVTGYLVSRNGLDANLHGAWGTTVPAGQRSFTFTNLVNGSTYDLTVITLDGTNQSAPTTVSVRPGAQTPSAPTAVVGTPGHRTATISWQPPEGDATVTGYRVSRDGVDVNDHGAWATTVPASQRSFTFTELVNGREYQLQIQAINSVGASPDVTVQVVPTARTRGGWRR